MQRTLQRLEVVSWRWNGQRCGNKMVLKDLQQQTPSRPPRQIRSILTLLCSVQTKTSLHGIQILYKKKPPLHNSDCQEGESLVRGSGAHESGVWCGGMAAGPGNVGSFPDSSEGGSGPFISRVTGYCRVLHTKTDG